MPDTPSSYLAGKSPKGQLKPFHSAVVSAEVLRVSSFERGLSTRLGTTYEECAKLIALDHHAEAHRGYEVVGDVSEVALGEIESNGLYSNMWRTTKEASRRSTR